MKLMEKIKRLFRRTKPEVSYVQVPFIPAGMVLSTPRAETKARSHWEYDVEWIDARSHVIDSEMMSFIRLEDFDDKQAWVAVNDFETFDYDEEEVDAICAELVRDCCYHDR